MLEKDIEAYLVKRIKELGGIPYKFVSPNRRNVPDRFCLLPHGLTIFVEVKGPEGRLTKGQQKELERIDALGHSCAVVYNKAEVDSIIEAVQEAIDEAGGKTN